MKKYRIRKFSIAWWAIRIYISGLALLFAYWFAFQTMCFIDFIF